MKQFTFFTLMLLLAACGNPPAAVESTTVTLQDATNEKGKGQYQTKEGAREMVVDAGDADGKGSTEIA
jgi:hypothetical protein